ncbi:MAG: DnaJ domain-containing protein [Kordiimonas sp.]
MIWLVIGLMLAGALLMMLNWWANAELKSAKTTLMWGIVGLCAVMAMLLLAAGRNIMAILPAGFAAWRMLGVANTLSSLFGRAKSFRQDQMQSSRTTMSRDEALEVLGLGANPSKDEINAAYRKLMAQCHPDKGGSDWMASKLSEARKTLLDKLS